MISKNIDTIDDKGRFVAIKLGLFFENERVCACGHDYLWHRHGEARGESVHCVDPDCDCQGYHDERNADPPDFLSPAGSDLLLRTLRSKHIDVEIHQNWLTLYGSQPFLEKAAPIEGEDHKPSLLDAAYNLLKALEEK